jgi:hypothetical protein
MVFRRDLRTAMPSPPPSRGPIDTAAETGRVLVLLFGGEIEGGAEAGRVARGEQMLRVAVPGVPGPPISLVTDRSAFT